MGLGRNMEKTQKVYYNFCKGLKLPQIKISNQLLIQCNFHSSDIVTVTYESNKITIEKKENIK